MRCDIGDFHKQLRKSTVVDLGQLGNAATVARRTDAQSPKTYFEKPLSSMRQSLISLTAHHRYIHAVLRGND